MPNSDSTLTRDRILRRAFARVGYDSPSTSELATGAEILNDVCADLDPQGRWLWTISNTESTFTTVANQRAYSVGVGASNIQNYILELQTMVIVRGTSRDEIRIIGKNESIESYELETTSGEPYLAHLKVTPDPANQTIILLPTPDAAYTINYTFQRMIYDFDSANDTPDFPRSMRLDLIKILAAELAPEFGATMQDRQALFAEAELAKKMMKAKNKERKDATRVCAQYF